MHAKQFFPKLSSPFIYLFIYLFGKQQDLSPTKINVPNHYFFFNLIFGTKNFSFFFSFFLDKKFGIFGFSKLDSTNFAIYFGEFLANIFISQI
jgi:hypothetical protein